MTIIILVVYICVRVNEVDVTYILLLVLQDPMASFDVNSLDPDPMPTYDLTDSNRHGTRCAGEVAAEANNSICAVGIAYEAGVGGM